MTTKRMCGPMLAPRVTVLVRSSGVVQLGWDPERALLLDRTALDTDTVLAFLRLLDGMHSRPQVIWRAGECGIEPEDAAELLNRIGDAGLLLHPDPRLGRVRSVRVHGLGPLSDAVATGLRRLGLRPIRSRGYRGDGSVLDWHGELVVLADSLVIEPRLANELVLHGIPHLQVRIRDGNKGIVGPLVFPGLTSCLRCLDLIRCEYDPEWPQLASQLLGRVGHASPAGILATAALLLGELEAIMHCSPERQLDTMNTTIELELDTHRISRREWPQHDGCGCRRIFAGSAG
ncbi:hypothetical protein AB0M12_33185 [Nocardia vinacea]|uniref:hypothetical protein n=1 Tax=Nocardia vinacea TaxID=96468 RepID=UPI00343F116D